METVTTVGRRKRQRQYSSRPSIRAVMCGSGMKTGFLGRESWLRGLVASDANDISASGLNSYRRVFEYNGAGFRVAPLSSRCRT